MLGNIIKSIKKDTSTVEESTIPIRDVRLVDWGIENLKSEDTIRPMKSGTYIRASGLGGVCAREEVLAARHDIIRTKPWSSDIKWAMAIGTGLHYVFQNEILGPRKLLTGQWKCSNCNRIHGSFSEPTVMPDGCDGCGFKSGTLICVKCHNECKRNRDPEIDKSYTNKVCEQCGEAWEVVPVMFEYVELYLVDHELGIHGHTDGFHPIPTDMWEFKTANGWSMKGFRNGDIYDKYKVQAQFYLATANRRRMRFVFLDKSTNSIKDSWLEVFVNRDQQQFDEIRSNIIALREGLDGGPLPKRICGTRSCPRAKECQLEDICFSV